MSKKIPAVILSALLAAAGLAFTGSASADPVTMVGTITKITVAADGKSAVAVLKDGKTGKPISIDITDKLTLDKFKDKRIVEGDEIRTKYDSESGKNHSKTFKKTAGC